MCCWCPRAAQQPVVPRRQLAELVAEDRTARRRRGALHQRWGHDFRPDYRRLRDLIARIPAECRVRDDRDRQQPGRGGCRRATRRAVDQEAPTGIRGPLARTSLRLGVLSLPTHDAGSRGSSATRRSARLGDHLHAHRGRRERHRPARREAGLRGARIYRPDRPRRARGVRGALEGQPGQGARRDQRAGHGIRQARPRLRVHLGAPSSPVSYYQQVGRAGRATASAMFSCSPASKTARSGTTSRPRRCPTTSVPERVLAALSASTEPLSTPALEAMVDIRRTPLELLLKVLDVDGAVARVQGGWIATGRGVDLDEDRYGRIAAERVAEQQHMIEYEETGACRMEFLQRSLDDDTATPCGRCDNCAGAWFPTAIADGATHSAAASLESACRSNRGGSGRPVPTGSACPCEGEMPPTSVGRGSGARAAHRPRMGRNAARDVRGGRRRWPGSANCARGVRPGAGRLGMDGASGRRRRDAVAIEPQLVGSLARGIAEDRTAADARRARARGRVRREGRAATAPSGSPESGAGSECAAARPVSTSRPVRCCWSMTSSTAGGR